MRKVYLLDDAIISPLGFSVTENLSSLKNEISGIKFRKNLRFNSGGFYAAVVDSAHINNAFKEIGNPDHFTKLEKMMILAVHQVLSNNKRLNLESTGLIVSTTKGNIDLLGDAGDFDQDRVSLSALAGKIKEFFNFRKEPVIVSNACVSGGLALAIAKRFIQAGRFENAVVVGGDLVSEFVVSGFQSFQAISETPCKPFSENRDGISLGEAAAALLVASVKNKDLPNVSLIGDASANDANHISGPSRTAEGLSLSIQNALKEANISAEKIDYISAHGTGTQYNDAMETVAFQNHHLENVPVNSFKAYYGHTLGASALLECILTRHSLLNGNLFTSLNYSASGKGAGLNIITEYRNQPLNYALKTASGFGGCNLALVFKKEENA